MDTAPAPQPLPSVAPPAPISTQAAAVHAECADSPPRSRKTASSDADPVSAAPQKLRLMCSYGGHIVPRPHDKSLCYVGGDTRIVVIDRQTSLCDLHNRLSRNLPNNQSFILKYQLPNEDLDSLISVTTDEDLVNMVEECDRVGTAGVSQKPSRLRLFLFPKSRPSVEHLLVETGAANSDDWFFSALNGKSRNLPASGGAGDRGLPESSSITNLLGLDDDLVAKSGIGGKDAPKMGGNGGANQDVHSVPDSPMLDTTSSFDSTSSTPPSVANLPVKVHAEENQKHGVLGVEDQFQQMNVCADSELLPPQKPEELRVLLAPTAVASGLPVAVGGDLAANRVFSDDERSEHGGHIKAQLQGQVQLPQPPVAQILQNSPDSVSSERSTRNPLTAHQEPIAHTQTVAPPNQTDIKKVEPNTSKLQGQAVQEPGYMLSSQYDQSHLHPLHHPQQYVHAGNQYFHAGALPIASYYSVYAPPHHPHQSLLDQQYPLYIMPARPAQGYSLQAQQPGYKELTQSVPSSRTEMAASGGLPLHVAYTSAIPGPSCSSKHEVPAGMYSTAAAPAPQMVQRQSQYVGFSQIPLPSQSINPASAGNAPPFTYELADPAHAQIYYTQPPPPAHYQTLTMPPAAAAMSEASAQVPAENIK